MTAVPSVLSNATPCAADAGPVQPADASKGFPELLAALGALLVDPRETTPGVRMGPATSERVSDPLPSDTADGDAGARATQVAADTCFIEPLPPLPSPVAEVVEVHDVLAPPLGGSFAPWESTGGWTDAGSNSGDEKLDDSGLDDKEDAAAPHVWTIQEALAAVTAIAPVPVNSPALARAPIGKTSGVTISAAPTQAQFASDGPLAEHSLAAISPAESTSQTAQQPPVNAAPFDPRLMSSAMARVQNAAVSADALPAPSGTAHLGHDPDLQQLDDLVRDIAALSVTTGRAAFRLTGEQLGALEVRLNGSEAGLAVTIRTHDDQGHHALAQAQQQLTDDLRGNGVKVAATNVLMGGGADRQRQDRPHGPPSAPIEARAAESEPSSSTNEPGLAGRYA
jgi:hypothetical protein